MTVTAAKETRTDRFLSAVERVGNKLPEPFTLFLILFGIIAVVSTAMAVGGVRVQMPGSDDVIQIKGLFTAEGLTWLTENLGENFVGFPPLVTVLPILLAVGVAEKSGMLGAVVRWAVGSAPRWALAYAVGFVGVMGSIMADTAFIIIPPLAAMVFKAAGRHPVAGLLGGFAAAGAGYSTNILVTSLDALFAGITSSVVQVLPDPGSPVNPLSNWYFNAVSSILLSLLAGFLIDKVLEPRIVKADVPTEQTAADEDEVLDSEGTAHQLDGVTAEVTADEKRGILRAVIAAAITAAIILVAVLLPGSPWRNEDGGFLPKSPLLNSIVFIVFTMFIVPGVVYGVATGTVKGIKDVTNMFGQAIKDMMGFLVLAFILGQFIALFNWSGVGQWIAVAGAEGLEHIGLTGYGAIIGFMLVASLLNLFIISGSALWTLMAAVFVPMFALIGYEPAFVQAAFRVGDSATQIITPLNPYMIVLLTFLRRWEPNAGLGTVMARLLPFTVCFWVVWAAILTVFFFLDLPIGPGNGIFLNS